MLKICEKRLLCRGKPVRFQEIRKVCGKKKVLCCKSFLNSLLYYIRITRLTALVVHLIDAETLSQEKFKTSPLKKKRLRVRKNIVSCNRFDFYFSSIKENNMKYFLVVMCCLLIASSTHAQDITQTDSCGSTPSFQPFAGLGVLNGGRLGVAMKINDAITVEAGLGLDLSGMVRILSALFIPYPATVGGAFSQGIILTPFSSVKRLSFILYNTYNFSQGKSMSAIQMMAGFILYDGETSDFRMSIGHAIRYAGESTHYRKLMYGVDFVLSF